MSYPYSYDYDYGYSYGSYLGNQFTVTVIAIIVAIILGFVLYFTFLSKKNEGKFTGTKEKIYNFLTFNRFYLEEILKLLYVVIAVVLAVVGIVLIFIGSAVTGLAIAVIGNIAIRVSYELIMMFIILCKKTVSIDKKLDKIAEFYGDDFGETPCEDCRWDSCDVCKVDSDEELEEGVEVAEEPEEEIVEFVEEPQEGQQEPAEGEMNISER